MRERQGRPHIMLSYYPGLAQLCQVFLLLPALTEHRSGAHSAHQNMYLMLAAIAQERDIVTGQDLAIQSHLPNAPVNA